MLRNAWIIPLLPTISFVVILFFGKRMPFKGAEAGIAALAASFVLSCISFVQWIDRVENATEGAEHGMGAFGKSLILQEEEGHVAKLVEPVTRHITWFQNGGFDFGVGIHIDGLAVMMMFVVTLISLLVHIYSTAYMHGDKRYTFFFAALSLFTSSMLLLVVADNTLQLLVGWELVGLCSFMLIGHWWEEAANSNAAVKAFLTTRTGDIGLLCGVIMTAFVVQEAFGDEFASAHGGLFNIALVNQAAFSPNVGSTLLLMTAVGLLMGIIGKSGQFPLHTWLPDAMAGPTPVSALIHAATMVVAGVYLGARVYPVFYEGFSIADGGVNPMAAVGGTTVIIGAALAFVQNDIKKVLAYSTISQLGYMVMGLGVGAWTAAVFHLFTHAFFKACLFLGAGSVSHSGSHHSFDMKADMGGLRKYMPQTFITFGISTLALCGIFPFAGFFSKDEILATAGASGYEFFEYVGLAGAVMTAAYMSRCVYLTFFGEYRGHHHPHESEAAITVPLWILAGLATVSGLLLAPMFEIEKFKEWVEPKATEAAHFFPLHLVHAEFEPIKAIIAVLVAGTGLLIGYLYYWKEMGPRGLTDKSSLARAGYKFLENKYFLDHLYTNIIVGGTKTAVANASVWINQNIIDAVPNLLGRSTVNTGVATYDLVDQGAIDGTYNGLANVTVEAGVQAASIQRGRLQLYLLMVLAAVCVIAVVLLSKS